MDPITVEIQVSPEQLADALIRKLLTPPAAQPATRIFVTSTPRIGETWPEQGGIYAGVMRGEKGQPDYHLIIAPAEQGEEKAIAWGPKGRVIADAASPFDGQANSQALTKETEAHPAALWATALSINGFANWYLPARHELRLAYLNAPESFSTDDWYWSSTQYAGYADTAWTQYFVIGTQYGHDKSFQGRARAVRRFLIN